MKNSLIIISFIFAYFWHICFSFGADLPKGDHDAFYIWQRSWRSGKVMNATTKNSHCNYYFLAGEFTVAKTARITPDTALFALPNRIIPVFRIHTSFFNSWMKDRKKLTAKTVSEFRRLCKYKAGGFSELQIDLDCPVSKLQLYGTFLSSIKKALPKGTTLSFTALPCHLKNSEFQNVAKIADYYVLQVHGLEVPKKFSDNVEILNIETAKNAIINAEKIDCPYLLALPTYAYQLNFDRHTHKFLFLNAEKIPPNKLTIIKKIIYPEFQDLLVLIRMVRSKKLKNCRRIIWFRLPVEGDRYNLDMDTLQLLRSGKAPKKQITTQWKENKNGTLVLCIKNRGILDIGKVNIAITWQNNDGVYDLFKGFSVSRNNNSVGILPNLIQSAIPSPGVSTPVGWFRQSPTKNRPKVTIDITINKRGR